MKSLLIILFFPFVTASAALNPGLFLDYYVHYDSLDNSIPENNCKVLGTITLDGLAIKGAMISTVKKDFQVFSNSQGSYEMIFSVSDSGRSIFCYYERAVKEIIIANYDFKSQHAVYIDFHLKSYKEIRPMKKPVIYMYSNQDISCDLTIIPNGELTFSYPLMKDGWEIELSKDEDLKVQGKAYPYLFWEGEGVIDYELKDNNIIGEVISKSQLTDYFESSLALLGLNFKERSDFITFWVPQLLEKEYVLIQWIVDTDYNEMIAKMEVNPEPDALRRVYMLASPTDNPHIELKPQKLNSFERFGFTIVEWGGTIIPFEQISKSL